MQKSSKIDQTYIRLGQLYKEIITPEIIEELRRVIRKSTSLLVARAVDLVIKNDLSALVPELVDAFPRFMKNGLETDKGCQSKTAIVKALNKFDYSEDDIYLSGVYYEQMEPVYGGKEDTAVDLRAECAFGLARIRHPRALYILADLLMEKSEKVRIAAAKTLTYIGEPECEMMLRMKMLAGDTHFVLGECLLGLMTMAPRRSLDFVARYLDDDIDIIEYAALSIGSSRLPEALSILMDFWVTHPYPIIRQIIALPIALIRSDEAFDFLLDVVRESDIKMASTALSALKLFSEDQYVQKVKEAVQKRNNKEILKKFSEEFA